MPVVVVALAASSFIGAAAAATAVGATMATMVCAGAVMVGSALTVVGTITGNQKLSKIGAVIGLVGGIGGAVNGMMEAGATAAAEEGATNAAASELAQGTATDAAVNAAGDAVQTSAVDLGTDGITAIGDKAVNAATTDLGVSAANSSTSTAGAAASATPAPDSLLASATPAPAAPAAAPTNNVLTTGNVAADAGKASVNTGSTEVGQTFTKANDLLKGNANIASGDYASATDTSGAFGSAPMPGAPGAPIDGGLLGAAKGYIGDVQAWAKANPLLAKAALEGTGALVKGMNPTEQEKAQMNYYKAQVDAANRRARWGSGRI